MDLFKDPSKISSFVIERYFPLELKDFSFEFDGFFSRFQAKKSSYNDIRICTTDDFFLDQKVNSLMSNKKHS